MSKFSKMPEKERPRDPFSHKEQIDQLLRSPGLIQRLNALINGETRGFLAFADKKSWRSIFSLRPPSPVPIQLLDLQTVDPESFDRFVRSEGYPHNKRLWGVFILSGKGCSLTPSQLESWLRHISVLGISRGFRHSLFANAVQDTTSLQLTLYQDGTLDSKGFKRATSLDDFTRVDLREILPFNHFSEENKRMILSTFTQK